MGPEGLEFGVGGDPGKSTRKVIDPIGVQNLWLCTTRGMAGLNLTMICTLYIVFLFLLQLIFKNEAVDVNIRWMAILYIKNGVERYWRKSAPQ